MESTRRHLNAAGPVLELWARRSGLTDLLEQARETLLRIPGTRAWPLLVTPPKTASCPLKGITSQTDKLSKKDLHP